MVDKVFWKRAHHFPHKLVFVLSIDLHESVCVSHWPDDQRLDLFPHRPLCHLCRGGEKKQKTKQALASSVPAVSCKAHGTCHRFIWTSLREGDECLMDCCKWRVKEVLEDSEPSRWLLCCWLTPVHRQVLRKATTTVLQSQRLKTI